MATLEAQKIEAAAHVALHGQLRVAPEITDGELSQVLDLCRRARIWTASTAYEPGDVVVPATRNGYRYVCVRAGTTAATAPTWPTLQNSRVVDGTAAAGVTWQQAGPDWKNVYDVTRALHLVWTMKAERVAHLYATSQATSSYQQQQVYEHCIAMANRYKPVQIA